MEIHWAHREKGPVVAAVIALVVLGLGSIFLTWQSIKRQRAVVENHMVLSSQVIIRGVEANLMRIMRSLRGEEALRAMFPELSRELFAELTSSGEVVFVGLFDARGKPLISSVGQDEKPLGLPPSGLASLRAQGVWSGMTLFDGAQTMAVALEARPPMVRLCSAGMGLGPDAGAGQGMGQGMRQGMMQGMRQGMGQAAPPGAQPDAAPEGPIYLVVGLSAERHLVQFNQYRRAAMFQTGYVFLAAVLLWFLAFAYQRRRDQGLRLGRLERFQSKLLDAMPDGLLTLGPDGEVLAANGSALELLCPLAGQNGGKPPAGENAGLVGRRWSELPFPALEPGGWQQVEHQGRRLEILSVPFQDMPEEFRDAVDRRASGEDVMEELLVLVRDRTKLRSLEEDLEEARRLATVGSLAAGVAHEVRNPLSSLRGFAQFFADKFKGKDPYESYATTMVQEADRLNRVVTDLLFLARPRTHAPNWVDLPGLLDSLRGLLRFDLEAKGLTLGAQPGTDLETGRVFADADALRQVLLNLLANSLDAVDAERGQVRVAASRERRPEGSGVWISVQDNGPGMPEEVRAQAFEPFFTAKPDGTGLGLAIVQAIMRAHRGAVEIDSEPGQGTSMRLFFPDPAPGGPACAPGKAGPGEDSLDEDSLDEDGPREDGPGPANPKDGEA